MSTWTLTVVDSLDIVTTTHPSLDDALTCFHDNFDPQGAFPRSLRGMRAAADAMGIRAEITKHDA